jgi:alkylhydroperoxidase family enzyme
MSKRIPRLEMDQLDARLAAALEPRIKRLGYLGEFFKCAGNLPEVCRLFLELTEALKEALPDRITEVVALTVAGKTGNDYERHQHERLSVKLGFSRDWIAAVSRLAPERAGPMSDAERAVQTFALACLQRHGRDCSEEFERVVDLLGPQQAIGVVMLVGRYATHAMTVNTLGLRPPVPSIFEEAHTAS